MNRRSGRLVGWLALVGTVALLGYAQRASGGKPEQDSLYHYSTAAGEFVFFVVVLGIALALTIGLPKRELLALRRPNSWVLAAVLAVVVLVAIVVLNAALDPFLHAGREQGLAPKRWEPAHAGAFAANFVVFGFFGPVVEEVTFRGVGFRLLERFGRGTAVVLVGLAFGVWHGLVDALPILTAFGIGLASLRAWTGSIYPSMLLHSAFNSLALVLAVTV